MSSLLSLIAYSVIDNVVEVFRLIIEMPDKVDIYSELNNLGAGF